MKRFRLSLFTIAVALSAGITSLVISSPAQALSGSDFQPGRIIDDQLFYEANSMSPLQIQDFLKSQLPQDSNGNPVCDTNGSKPYYGTYGGVTYNGNILRRNLDSRYPAPYTCLYQYVEDTKVANSGAQGSGANNIGNPSWTPSTADCPIDSTGVNTCSAAYIIYNAAQQYSISPKVLIVLIQKEQFLVTDDWPWYPEYKSATGYGCPDTAACDSTYYGFYNQVHNAARQFRLYTNTPNNYNYTIGSNQILYNPNAACGREAVNIQNQATANLYDYTPYVPNQAALNNLYGTGDSCSSYGNRNFWRLYNDWFGSTLGAAIIEAPNDPRLFVVDGGSKHWISTSQTYAAWGFNSNQTSQVSQSYFDSLPTGSELTRYAKNANGTLYLLDRGFKHWVQSSTYQALWGIPNSQVFTTNSLLDGVPEAEWAGRFAKSASDGTIWLIDNTNKYQLPTGDDQYHWGLTPYNFTYASSDLLANYVTGPNLGEDVGYGGNGYVVDQSKIISIPNQQVATSWGISQFVAIDPIAASFLGTPSTATNFVRDPSTAAWYMLTTGSRRYIPNGMIAEAWGYGTTQPLTLVSTSLLSKFPAAPDLVNFVQESGTGKDFLIDVQKYYIPDQATFNAWLPANATLPAYDTNSLAPLAAATASTVIEPSGSANIYTVDHGQKDYILNGNIMNAWGVPRIASVQQLSYSFVASLPEGAPASLFVSSGGSTYFLENGYSHAVPANLAAAWGATSPTSISAEALARFAVGSTVGSFISYNGSYYTLVNGRKYSLGSYADAYGASSSNSLLLGLDFFPSNGLTASYITQSTDPNDPRMWLVSNGTKYYFDNFARLASYGFVSQGVGVSYVDSNLLAGLPTQSPLAPLCIQKPGSGIKFLNFGTAMGFPDSTTLAAYCPAVTTVSASIYDHFALTGSLSRVVKDDSGKIYFIQNGSKHWITSPSTYNAQYSSFPLTYLYGTTVSLIPDGTPIN